MYQVTFLHHSGILVETEHFYLLFDYDMNLKNDLDFYKNNINKKLFVFVSHNHADHFHPMIFDWSKSNPNIHYIVSYDITIPSHLAQDMVTSVKPHQTYDFDSIQVSTLESNDEGVAFLVKADGHTFFHAGDLNWWHWNGESDEFNQGIAQSYQSEILQLKEHSIDAAFIPADPRLEENFSLAIDFFAKTVHSNYIFPIHFWGQFSVCQKVATILGEKGYDASVVQIEKNGQTFSFS